MKRKLTLTVEESVIRAGKEMAKREGTSLSQLVEQRLREAEEAAQPSVARKWRGRFRGASAAGDPRMEYLEKHYK
jgi:hypothetical protein